MPSPAFRGSLTGKIQEFIVYTDPKLTDTGSNITKRLFDIDYEDVETADQILTKFKEEINGYILYDPNMPHELNMASTLGALKNAIPVSTDLEKDFKNLGFQKAEDISGRWETLHEAYEWGLKELQPQCNQKIMAQICVHYPKWPTSTFTNRDYVMAHSIFSFDISTSERDKRDFQLSQKIQQAYPQDIPIIGWHCVRDTEHDNVALSADNGHYWLCSLNSSNLSVHSSIAHQKKNKKFKQRSIKKQDLEVKNKVYIAFMDTDGDSAWFMQNHINYDWKDPAHVFVQDELGDFYLSGYDLMPGMVQYYMENLLPNDYFMSATSGAAYTYPARLPHCDDYLKMTQYYMEKCGLKVAHLGNWDDRDWWQEMDLPEFPDKCRSLMPNCVGFVRGMGESAFEKHYIKGGTPFLFFGEGHHPGDGEEEIYQTLKNFIDACPNRPLFIADIVNIGIRMSKIKAALDRFPEDLIEVVHFDELMFLIEKAFEQGKITEELYPDKSGLLKLITDEANLNWPNFYNEIKEFRQQYKKGESSYIITMQNTPFGLESIVPGDFLAFQTIWHAMKCVKLSLEARGIYVNHKPTASTDFVREFKHMPDVEIIADLQQLWDNWHNKSLTFNEAKQLANRFVKLVEKLNETINQS